MYNFFLGPGPISTSRSGFHRHRLYNLDVIQVLVREHYGMDPNWPLFIPPTLTLPHSPTILADFYFSQNYSLYFLEKVQWTSLLRLSRYSRYTSNSYWNLVMLISWRFISCLCLQVLGTPTREEIRCMNPSYTEFKFPQIKAHPWHKVSVACGNLVVTFDPYLHSMYYFS